MTFWKRMRNKIMMTAQHLVVSLVSVHNILLCYKLL